MSGLSDAFKIVCQERDMYKTALINLRKAQKAYMAERGISSKERLNELGQVVDKMAKEADWVLGNQSSCNGVLMEYIIYRDKVSGKITSYSKYTKEPDNLDKLIAEHNSNHARIAERVTSEDVKSLILIAEANKILKQDEIKGIEYAFDCLQNEIYDLQKRFEL